MNDCSMLPLDSRNTAVSRTENRGAISVFLAFFFAVLSAAAYLYHIVGLLTLGQQWYNSSRTSRSYFCDNYELCFFVCVCAYVRMCACFWTIPTHTSSAFETHPRSTAAVQQQQQQSQRYNTSEPHRLIYIREPCVHPFQLATPPGFQVNQHPEGRPCITIHLYSSTTPDPNMAFEIRPKINSLVCLSSSEVKPLKMCLRQGASSGAIRGRLRRKAATKILVGSRFLPGC